ncbi:hypothetical protein C2G38_2047269 [Gigaspora rosea]|uniref:Uncharacterized protein n=1 Tax=Gigaspora rosea TaxID=44941 RepID=A0A397U7Z6_9GLOM|nr:hypothetical protein C2G38_2047269 [Gigaspora rosea]
MFVRILQILALLALVNTSTTYVIHINNTTNSNITERDHTYPIHTVHWKSRGYTDDVDNIKIHFLDYQQQSKWTYTSEHLADQVNSAGWSVGYYVCAEYTSFIVTETVCGDVSTLWWDGWVGQKFCTDLHFHLKKSLKLSVTSWTINPDQYC